MPVTQVIWPCSWKLQVSQNIRKMSTTTKCHHPRKKILDTNCHECLETSCPKLFLSISESINWRSSEMQFRHNECMCSPCLVYTLFLATVLYVLACCWHLNKLHRIICIQDQVRDTANHSILVLVQWSIFYIVHSTWEHTNYKG